MWISYRCGEIGLRQLGNLRNWIWEIWVKHPLQTNLTKTITLNANTQEIITLKTL